MYIQKKEVTSTGHYLTRSLSRSIIFVIFFIIFRITFVKIWALNMTIRMSTSRVTRWYSRPSINNSP